MLDGTDPGHLGGNGGGGSDFSFIVGIPFGSYFLHARIITFFCDGRDSW